MGVTSNVVEVIDRASTDSCLYLHGGMCMGTGEGAVTPYGISVGQTSGSIPR